MWQINSGGYETFYDLFGDDGHTVFKFSSSRTYQIEVSGFKHVENSKYRIFKFEDDPSTPKPVRRRILFGEFDNPEELVAMVKLVMASGETY